MSPSFRLELTCSFFFFFFNDTATTEIYTLSLHDALPISQTRMNVVYVGGNDGLLHGFRSGSYDLNGNFVATGNDGLEVLAYMPGAVVQTIHSTTASVDYSNAQYGHNFFVDAMPGAGDLFYGNAWHSWVVGGLGPGGSAIFALDVTNPTTGNFTEANAASLVIRSEERRVG